MKNIFSTILSIFVITFNFSQLPDQELPDSVYNEMIWFAKGEIVKNDTIFKVGSNSNFYVVINVTNRSTNETKEICTLYKNLDYAIRLDSNVSINEESRDYSILSDKALEVLGFYDYEYGELSKCTKNINVDSLYSYAINSPYEFANKYSGKCKKYIAHLFFNNGIMSSIGSLTDSLSVMGKNFNKQELLKEYLDIKD